jgi:hypothetical protein
MISIKLAALIPFALFTPTVLGVIIYNYKRRLERRKAAKAKILDKLEW